MVRLSQDLKRIVYDYIIAPVLRTRAKIAITLGAGPIILVYTPGKVGSSSLFQLLKQGRGALSTVFQVHFLNKQQLDLAEDWLRTSGASRTPPHIKLSRLFDTQSLRTKKELIFLTIVRNPIDRLISDVFENLNLYVPDCNGLNTSDNRALVSTKIFELLSKEGTEGDYVQDWFNHEFLATTGIDMSRLSKAEDNFKYRAVREGSQLVLLLTLEAGEAAWLEALDLHGLEVRGKLPKKNMGADKHYAELYRDVKEQLKLPPQIVERVLSADYISRLYSEQQIAEMRGKWL